MKMAMSKSVCQKDIFSVDTAITLNNRDSLDNVYLQEKYVIVNQLLCKIYWVICFLSPAPNIQQKIPE